MVEWRPQHFLREGKKKGIPSNVLQNSVDTAELTSSVNARLPPIFSLRHLAHLSKVDYGFIRSVVSRALDEPYTVFKITKRFGAPKKKNFRVICAPDPPLLLVQRWIAKHVLNEATPHSASVAYAPNSKIKDAAGVHCGQDWLIKLDVSRFFESISEIGAYRVFRELGYQPLISFEMARICSRLGSRTLFRSRRRWRADYSRYSVITEYGRDRLGHLPQGAPTSPMLSNLAMFDFDKKVAKIAAANDLIYTRYADDLCLSTSRADFTRKSAGEIVGKIYRIMKDVGLSPNVSKTHVSPPGSRKIVLGLLVNDRDEPGLTREFRARIRQHVHYLTHPNIGPAKHAAARKFQSALGMRNHIFGLIAFARAIDPDFANDCEDKLRNVIWPL